MSTSGVDIDYSIVSIMTNDYYMGRDLYSIRTKTVVYLVQITHSISVQYVQTVMSCCYLKRKSIFINDKKHYELKLNTSHSYDRGCHSQLTCGQEGCQQ